LPTITCEKYRQIKSLGIITSILLIFLFSANLFNVNLNTSGINRDDRVKTSSSFLLLDYQNLMVSEAELLYTEDFNDGVANQWVTIGGTWTVENNQYKVTDDSEGRVRSYYSGQSFYNYSYEGDLMLASGAEIQLIFNVQDIFSGEDLGHYCQITLFYDVGDERGDSAILYSVENGQIDHTQASFDFNHNQWYHFKIVSIGSYVDFYLDNALILSYSGLSYSSGYIGVKAMYGPVAYWDNIKVSRANIIPIEVVLAIVIPIVIIAIVATVIIIRKKVASNKSRSRKDEVARYKKLKELERQGTPVQD